MTCAVKVFSAEELVYELVNASLIGENIAAITKIVTTFAQPSDESKTFCINS